MGAPPCGVMIQLRQKRGYSVATFDLEIHPAMNFLTPAGFLSLASILVPLKWTYLMDLNGPSGVISLLARFRLTLWVLLQESPDSLNMAGVDCAPWGMPARGTTGRSILNILGRQELSFVSNGNQMIARLLEPKFVTSHQEQMGTSQSKGSQNFTN